MSELTTSPPPLQTTLLHVWVLDGSSQLRHLRANLRAAVNTHADTGDQALADVAETMVLVATELTNNAMKHGLPPTTVRLSHTSDQFVLDVGDHDLATIPELAQTRPYNAGGRGLHLARALSLQVGWYATHDAKHVWAAFPIHP